VNWALRVWLRLHVRDLPDLSGIIGADREESPEEVLRCRIVGWCLSHAHTDTLRNYPPELGRDTDEPKHGTGTPGTGLVIYNRNVTNISVDQLESRRDFLRTRATELRTDIARLTDELREVDAQLKNADVALDFIREVVAPSPVTITPDRDTASDAAAMSQDDPVLTIVAIRTPTGRVKTTDLIAAIVRKADGPVPRAELHRYARAIVGEPIPWENPSTAINNAIARAVENKLIHLVGGDRFAVGAPSQVE